MSRNTVVKVSSGILYGMCDECQLAIPDIPQKTDFEVKVNHYIHERGYRLRHVGQETDEDNQGRLWHHTVAVLQAPS